MESGRERTIKGASGLAERRALQARIERLSAVKSENMPERRSGENGVEVKIRVKENERICSCGK